MASLALAAPASPTDREVPTTPTVATVPTVPTALTSLAVHAALTVGDLRVEPLAMCRRLMVATVAATVSATGDEAASDYEPSRWRDADEALWHNVHELARASARRPKCARDLRLVVRGVLAGRTGERATPLALPTFAIAPPTLVNVISRRELCGALGHAALESVRENGDVNVHALRGVFRLTDAELGAFAVAVSGALRALRVDMRVDASGSLGRFMAPIVEMYDALPERIEWVMAGGASSCRTPAPMTPREWYGAFYVKAVRPPTKDETVAMLHARMCASGAPLGGLGRDAIDGTCALCFGAVSGGGRNSVTLRCRHTFHFGETDFGCKGLLAWSAGTCPVCRLAFVPRQAERSERATHPLDVAWPVADAGV
jgi:hypothetical protein